MRETFKVIDFPFVFFTLSQCRRLLSDAGVTVVHEVAADGVSALLQKQIDQMDAEMYAQYMKYHFYCCEKPEMLGRPNHLLFVAKNGN